LSTAAVDGNLNRCADFAHPHVRKVRNPLGQNGDGDAFHRIEVDGRSPLASSLGSRNTSLGSPQMAVVHGATSAMRSKFVSQMKKRKFVLFGGDGLSVLIGPVHG
jgi:hypothetical protein